jgi:hypothetical protein
MLELFGAVTAALAVTLFNAARSVSSSRGLFIDFLSFAGALFIAGVPITLVGWRNHFYSLLISDGKLETRSFSGAPRQAVQLAGLSLVPLERLSFGQRLGATLELTDLSGSSLRFAPVFFSHPQLQQLRLALRAHGAV